MHIKTYFCALITSFDAEDTLCGLFQISKNKRSLVTVDVCKHRKPRSGPKVIKLFSCSTHLSMKFVQHINFKMPTIVGILTFMSGKNSILGIYEPKKSRMSLYVYSYKFHAQLS